MKHTTLVNVEIGAAIGGLAGLLIFGSAGLFVDLHSPVQAGVNSISSGNANGWIITFVLAFLGLAFGGAGGAFVGIGSPSKMDLQK